MTTERKFWESMWVENRTKWDIGYAAPPIVEYMKSVTDKAIEILIPGSGNAYEAEHLHNTGFKNVYVMDIAPQPLENFKKRVPDFPKEHLLNEDFFAHNKKYDLIIEQAFFIAIDPAMRGEYAKKIHGLLKPGGRLVGLLIFDSEPSETGPPYIDTKEEYKRHFDGLFEIKKFEIAYNSIKPRAGREMFIEIVKV